MLFLNSASDNSFQSLYRNSLHKHLPYFDNLTPTVVSGIHLAQSLVFFLGPFSFASLLSVP
jgi:hypothetical protein